MSYVALVLIRLGGSGLVFYKEHLALFWPVLPHPGLELSAVFFFLFPYSSRNLLVKFENLSQSIELVGNRFNRFC